MELSMHYNDGTMIFSGLHFFWWILMIFIIVGPMFFYVPYSRSKNNESQFSPLEILQKRYANGKITDAEYEHRKSKIELDNVKLHY
jgi:putative membrane protein